MIEAFFALSFFEQGISFLFFVVAIAYAVKEVCEFIRKTSENNEAPGDMIFLCTTKIAIAFGIALFVLQMLVTFGIAKIFIFAFCFCASAFFLYLLVS